MNLLERLRRLDDAVLKPAPTAERQPLWVRTGFVSLGLWVFLWALFAEGHGLGWAIAASLLTPVAVPYAAVSMRWHRRRAANAFDRGAWWMGIGAAVSMAGLLILVTLSPTRQPGSSYAPGCHSATHALTSRLRNALHGDLRVIAASTFSSRHVVALAARVSGKIGVGGLTFPVQDVGDWLVKPPPLAPLNSFAQEVTPQWLPPMPGGPIGIGPVEVQQDRVAAEGCLQGAHS